MVIHDLDKFEELATRCGNRYLAIQIVAKAARQFTSNHKEYSLNESKVIQWILTGDCPYTPKQLADRKYINSRSEIDEILCWVSDSEVAEEVRKMYKKSVRSAKLQLSTNSALSNSQLDRANILLRMAWYSTGEEENNK